MMAIMEKLPFSILLSVCYFSGCLNLVANNFFNNSLEPKLIQFVRYVLAVSIFTVLFLVFSIKYDIFSVFSIIAISLTIGFVLLLYLGNRKYYKRVSNDTKEN